MAENKKSIIIYADWINTFEQLDDDEAGRLIKHLFRYVNDQNPEPPDKLTKVVFEPIKQQLKRDLEKWEGIREKRSKAGQVSAELRSKQKLTSVEQNPTHVEINTTNVTVNDNVNVNVIKDNIPDKSGLDFNELIGFINKYTGRNFKSMNEKIKSKYRTRIKEGYTKAQIANAIMVASQTTYHKENNYQYLTPEFFSRADKLDMYGTAPGKAETNPSFTAKTQTYAK